MNGRSLHTRIRRLVGLFQSERVEIAPAPETFPEPLPSLADYTLDAWERARELEPGDTLVSVGIGTFTRLVTGELVANVRTD